MAAFTTWLILSSSVFCRADDPAGVALRGVATLAQDTWTLVSAPARLRTEHLPTVLTAAGATFLPAIIDRPLDDAIEGAASHDLDRTYDAVEPFGRVRASYIAGGTVLAAGLATGSDTALRAGAECVEAGLFTITLTSLLKNATGRLRPGETDDPFEFHPFDRGNAWPSSHAAQAFASAAVFTSYTPWWGDMLLLAGASTVAGFDLYDNRHWASDIAGGALLGWVIGRAVVKMHEESSGRKEGEQSVTFSTVGASPAAGTGLFVIVRR